MLYNWSKSYASILSRFKQSTMQCTLAEDHLVRMVRWYARLCVRAYKLAVRARVDRRMDVRVRIYVYVCSPVGSGGQVTVRAMPSSLGRKRGGRRHCYVRCLKLPLAAARCWATRLTDANEPPDIGCVLYIAIRSRRENSIRARGINLRREVKMPSCNRMRIRTIGIGQLHAVEEKKHVNINKVSVQISLKNFLISRDLCSKFQIKRIF